MKFGIAFFSIIPKKANIYDLLLAASQYADQNDFSAIWIPERHFDQFGGHFPNPSTICAALSTITKKISLRAGSIISPLHDVLRIAEEWSVVDNLSDGRVGLSFGSGWNCNDFSLSAGNYSRRHQYMYQQISQLKMLWSGGQLQRRNGNDDIISIQHQPPPKQKELPIWLSISSNKDSFKKAGELGLNIYTHLVHQSIDELEKNILIYKHAREQAGYEAGTSTVTVMLHTYIGSGKHQDVLQVAEQPFMHYLSNIIGFGGVRASRTQDSKAIELYKDELMKLTYNKFIDGRALIGNIEYCGHIIDKLAAIGVNEIACLVDFGVKQELVLNSLSLIKENFISDY